MPCWPGAATTFPTLLMTELSWAATVRLVHERADGRCEYCQTRQDVIGQAMHVEHILPAGGDDPANLCLSCPSCNLSKATATSAEDPGTNQTAPLYNPRQQVWSDHFVWDDDALRIVGLNPTGRATVERLKMNRDRIVAARALWKQAGLHP